MARKVNAAVAAQAMLNSVKAPAGKSVPKVSMGGSMPPQFPSPAVKKVKKVPGILNMKAK